MSTTSSSSCSPNVVIAGGGPSGLLAAILFGQFGIATTVLERSSKPDPWSTKSYSIVLGTKGMAALQRAGEACLEAAREMGMPRRCIIFHSPDGSTRVVSKQNEDSLGFSRQLLVACLESIASKQPNVTIKRGCGVSSVRRIVSSGTRSSGNESSASSKLLEVLLEDGCTLGATHVIGADGKWSNVRASFPDEFQATTRIEPSFGVHIMVPSVPDGWRDDGTHVIQPSKECMFYIIAAPIPSGELSVSMVCYDETLERYPWLSPPEDNADDTAEGMRGWEDEYSALPATETVNCSEDASSLADKLGDLFDKELPSFLAAIGRENLGSARINRRVSWVELVSAAPSSPVGPTTTMDTSSTGTTGEVDVDDRGSTTVTFASRDGRIALIGDAAHAITPSRGEGCNTAMDSAVALVDSLAAVTSKTSEGAKDTVCVQDLVEAFISYGHSRPEQTLPIQQMSAAACRFKKV